MVAALRGSRMKSFLYTNGTVFSRLTPEQICAWNLNHVVLSIDGLDAAWFERQRKGSDYPKVRRAAEKFAAHKSSGKPIFEIRHVILPNESNSDRRAFRKDWLQIADTVKFNFLLPLHPHGAAVPTEVRCRDIRREAYIRWDGRLLLCAGQVRQHPPEWLGDATKIPSPNCGSINASTSSAQPTRPLIARFPPAAGIARFAEESACKERESSAAFPARTEVAMRLPALGAQP